MGEFRRALEQIVANTPRADRPRVRSDVAKILTAGVEGGEDLLRLLRTCKDADLLALGCWIVTRLDGAIALRAARALVALLADSRPAIRAAAARSLATSRSKYALSALLKTMGDPTAEVRKAAIYGVGLSGNRRALAPLISMLNNEDQPASVRGMAAEALGNLADQRAVKPLIAALDDKSPEVRFFSIFALGEIGAREAVASLSRVMKSDRGVLPGYGSLAEEAATVLRRIGRGSRA
jgi:HEAT repeat protein